MKLKRIQALFLAVLMIFSMTTNMIPAFAIDSSQDPDLCLHHTEHIDCSYREGSEGSPCTHEHDANCGYIEAKKEVPCDKGCTDTDGDGDIDHAPDCAYQPAVEGQECTPVSYTHLDVYKRQDRYHPDRRYLYIGVVPWL